MRDTVSAPADDVWEALFHPQMMEAWLRTGRHEPDGGSPGPYPFAGGGDGSIEVLEIRRHIRLAWHPDGWPGPTTLDIRAIPEQGEEEAEERTVVEFRQERVPGEREREARQAVLTAAMETLRARLEEE